MQILHIQYDDIQNTWLSGGGALQAYQINRRLVERGHSVTMLTGIFPGGQRDERVDGIRYLRLGNPGGYYRSRLSFSRAVGRMIRTIPHDLLVEDTSAYSYPFSYWYSSKPRIAIVHHLMGSHSFRKFKLLGLIPYAWESFNIRHFQHIIIGSPGTRDEIRKRYHHHYHLYHIPYGINPDLFKSTPVEKDYILYLGRMDIYNKGIDILLESFTRIMNDFPELRLVIAGRGREESEVREMVQKHPAGDRVEFLGRIEEDQKRELLSQCRLMVMPSRFEGWGISALEASACGKPVLGTDIPGLRDAVLHQQTGWLAKSEDPQDYADQLKYLLQDHSCRHRLGRQAREWALTFSWDQLADQQLEVYRRILAGTVPNA
ncbi:MAG: glycosyltransferase family 4 protein [Candidatus Delongbacteria bacterium]|nr:glycosyltransferase family 4 protein [Candidatus Delongbacteria bacterium]